MKKHLYITLTIGVLALPIASEWAAIAESKKLPDGAQYIVDGGTLRI